MSSLRRAVNRLIFYFLVGVVVALGCKARNSRPAPEAKKFEILLVGEGIPATKNSSNQLYPLNRSEAAAMDRGAALAFKTLPHLKVLRGLATIVRRDDRGIEEEAAKIARRFQFDPRVLAVIGHSASGSTREALTYYREAGIPVLMPIATSPAAASEVAFRLPLNDKVGQAPALADFIVQSLKANKVHIVQDVGRDARGYTEPLTTYFRDLLPSDRFAWIDEVRTGETDFAQEARNVMAYRADVVLFVGYASTAILFMDSLRVAFSETAERPTVVLTDGSISEDLWPNDFKVYVSAPFPDLSASSCHSSAKGLIANRKAKTPNYEAFGFDAMSILGEAVKRCERMGEISRQCLRQVLASGKFDGVCNDYYFVSGENQEGQYTIFSVVGNRGSVVYSPYKAYSASQLQVAIEAFQ